MSNTTAKLQLPYILASQAQKHVSYNEAILKLDSLVQLSVISKDQTAPPGVPADGDGYIVPIGGTGAWAGQTGNLAVWSDTAWAFSTPSEGWTSWVSDLDQLWSFDGTNWMETAPAEDFQNIPMLGVNTTADLTNRLSVSAPETLLSHEGAGHQLKLNKNASTDTASMLFQETWTGYAEMGLAGDNDFTIKTSDGASWFSALKCNLADGQVSFPSGISGRIETFGTGNSVFIGRGAGESDDLTDNKNVFVGNDVGKTNSTGGKNTGIGGSALYSNTTGGDNVASGYTALYSNTTGNFNTASGRQALYQNISGSYNAAYGRQALRYTTAGGPNTTYSNCAGLGNGTRVSGSNQVQLGNSSTTTYAYGAIQDRSDARDKTDVRDTKLGLSFINRLRAVDFRWDMRDDYFDYVEKEDPETGELVETLVRAKKDGSRKRGRFHHGLIAQEVAEVVRQGGADFGGFQDHSRSGGNDIMSIGYTELIGPLIKAVQELTAKVAALEK